MILIDMPHNSNSCEKVDAQSMTARKVGVGSI